MTQFSHDSQAGATSIPSGGHINARGESQILLVVITGSEGYGVATVLKQMATLFPGAQFYAFKDGPFLKELPEARIAWVGTFDVEPRIARSSIIGLASIFGKMRTWILAARQLRLQLPDSSCILHCHNLFTAIVAGLAVRGAKQTCCKVVYHFHGTISQKRLWGCMHWAQQRVLSSLVDAIISVSQYSAAAWPNVRCKTFTIYNGMPRPALSDKPLLPTSYNPRKKYILLAGALVEEKGHLVAVKALKELLAEHEDYHLWIAGGPISEAENPFAVKLKDAITMMGLENDVTLLGRVENVSSLIKASDIVLQQRITPEPFGLWTLECMANGGALIASNTGATCELVRHMKEAILVSPNDPHAVAEGIRVLASNQTLKEELKSNAIMRSGEFGLERFCSGLEHVYASLSKCDV